MPAPGALDTVSRTDLKEDRMTTQNIKRNPARFTVSPTRIKQGGS
jgi:hypothetical protein